MGPKWCVGRGRRDWGSLHRVRQALVGCPEDSGFSSECAGTPWRVGTYILAGWAVPVRVGTGGTGQSAEPDQEERTLLQTAVVSSSRIGVYFGSRPSGVANGLSVAWERRRGLRKALRFGWSGWNQGRRHVPKWGNVQGAGLESEFGAC